MITLCIVNVDKNDEYVMQLKITRDSVQYIILIAKNQHQI